MQNPRKRNATSAKDGQDTIAAIATPPGKGGVGIVRISGPEVASIATQMLGTLPKARYALHTPFLNKDGQTIDSGIALYFRAPHSFTGEDVLELQGHGGPVVLNLLLQRALKLGCRLARPGEFSERAFLNDKMDLAQAEAVADLIDASSEQAARMAVRSLTGEFSTAINTLLKQLIALRVQVEAAIDFPEEEIDFLAEGTIWAELDTLMAQVESILQTAKQGVLLKEGIVMVIVGEPNVGKSSLLNCLSGEETAIVTDIAGTTRDVLSEYIHIDGLPIKVLDTAGIRDTDDVVEREGVKRAKQAMADADLILYVRDASDSHNKNKPSKNNSEATATNENEALVSSLQETANKATTLIIENKIDLTSQKPEKISREGDTIIRVSVKEKQGIFILKEAIKSRYQYQPEEGSFIARQRHITAIETCYEALKRAHAHRQDGELLAEECYIAQQALSMVTGRFTNDDLLGEIFANFCIGK